MQEKSQPHFDPVAIEGTLLTRDYLEARKRSKNSEFIARIEAKKIINEAWRQSEMLKKQSFNEGFEAGLICCIENIVAHFNATDRQQKKLESVLEEKIVQMMKTIFRDNEIFLSVVIDWYKLNKVSESSEVLLTLPFNKKKLAEKLCERLRPQLLIEPKVVFHPHNFYQVKTGDQLIEFNSSEFSEKIVHHLLYSNDDISLRVREISRDSLQRLQSLFPC